MRAYCIDKDVRTTTIGNTHVPVVQENQLGQLDPLDLGLPAQGKSNTSTEVAAVHANSHVSSCETNKLHLHPVLACLEIPPHLGHQTLPSGVPWGTTAFTQYPATPHE